MRPGGRAHTGPRPPTERGCGSGSAGDEGDGPGQVGSARNGRRLLVVGPSQVDDHLAREGTEIPTSPSASLSGRQADASRAARAIGHRRERMKVHQGSPIGTPAGAASGALRGRAEVGVKDRPCNPKPAWWNERSKHVSRETFCTLDRATSSPPRKVSGGTTVSASRNPRRRDDAGFPSASARG
jgi:hypothetical protein